MVTPTSTSTRRGWEADQILGSFSRFTKCGILEFVFVPRKPATPWIPFGASVHGWVLVCSTLYPKQRSQDMENQQRIALFWALTEDLPEVKGELLVPVVVWF